MISQRCCGCSHPIDPRQAPLLCNGCNRPIHVECAQMVPELSTSFNASGAQKVTVRVIASFNPNGPRQLPVRSQDVLEVDGVDHRGWYEAKDSLGLRGIVPVSYCQMLPLQKWTMCGGCASNARASAHLARFDVPGDAMGFVVDENEKAVGMLMQLGYGEAIARDAFRRNNLDLHAAIRWLASQPIPSSSSAEQSTYVGKGVLVQTTLGLGKGEIVDCYSSGRDEGFFIVQTVGSSGFVLIPATSVRILPPEMATNAVFRLNIDASNPYEMPPSAQQRYGPL